MRSRKSVIPVNAQIPVAIVLGIVLVLLVAWRVNGAQGDASAASSAPMPRADAPLTQPEMLNPTLDNFKLLLAEIEAARLKGAGRMAQIPPLSRNPFLAPVTPPVLAGQGAHGMETGSEDASSETGGEYVNPAERGSVLESLDLSATIRTATGCLAMINGRLFKAGDSIGGFTIKEIREREIVLQDELGTETIEIAKEPIQ